MTDQMTQAKAEAEMKIVKAILDRHVDMGWLASYGHDLQGQFEYTFWEGKYEVKRDMELEDAA